MSIAKFLFFSDPQLKKAKGEILPNTPFTIEQLFVNDEGKAVFKIADKGYVLADSSVIFLMLYKKHKKKNKTCG